jgi:hypothetical protein
MSYVDIHDDDIKEMDDEKLESIIRFEIQSHLNNRYPDARRENLIKLLAESKKRDPNGILKYTKGPPPNCYVWG